MKKKCVIVCDGYYLKGIETVSFLGGTAVWVKELERARVFESKACARDILKGYWFDGIRKRCKLLTVE